MSQQANKLLADLLEERPEGMPWNEAVDAVKSTCDVKKNTAETYIRRSDQAAKEITVDGDKMVVSPSSSETVVHDEDDVLEMEVGDTTSSKFGNLTVLEDVGHPMVPTEHENGYYRRRMSENTNSDLAKKTDVQVTSASMEDNDFSTLLIGKHGVGKDKLILHLCANTNRPVIRLVGNDDPDFIDLLIGTFQPDADGGFVRKKGLLQVAIENGYTFVIDEFNNLSGKVQTMLNKILEGADQQTLTIPETNEVIEPHEQFKFVATMNPNEVGYGGRERLDAATSSRFFPIEIPPLDVDAEKSVVAQETDWEESDHALDTLLSEHGGVINGIRALKDQGKIQTWVSTRDVIQIGRMANTLGSAQAAAELVLVGRAEPEDEEPIRSAIHDSNW